MVIILSIPILQGAVMTKRLKMDEESNQNFNQQASVRTGSLLCWHGQERIAKVVNQAGTWSENHQVKNMFDENSNTFWHSGKGMENRPKAMRIEFKVSFWSEE